MKLTVIWSVVLFTLSIINVWIVLSYYQLNIVPRMAKIEFAYTEAQKGERCTAIDCRSFCEMHFKLAKALEIDISYLLPEVCNNMELPILPD